MAITCVDFRATASYQLFSMLFHHGQNYRKTDTPGENVEQRALKTVVEEHAEKLITSRYSDAESGSLEERCFHLGQVCSNPWLSLVLTFVQLLVSSSLATSGLSFGDPIL
jgi:hypothetical protein